MRTLLLHAVNVIVTKTKSTQDVVVNFVFVYNFSPFVICRGSYITFD